MFHRDIRHSTRLNPANRLCRHTRPRRVAVPRTSHPRHATAIGRVAACAAVFTVAALAGCSSEPPVGGATTTADDGTMTVTVLMKDMHFEPDVIEVAPGTHVVLETTNTDSMPHDLVFENELGTDLLPRDSTATLDLGVIDADLDGWCSVSGHRAAGMTLTIEVVDA